MKKIEVEPFSFLDYAKLVHSGFFTIVFALIFAIFFSSYRQSLLRLGYDNSLPDAMPQNWHPFLIGFTAVMFLFGLILFFSLLNKKKFANELFIIFFILQIVTAVTFGMLFKPLNQLGFQQLEVETYLYVGGIMGLLSIVVIGGWLNAYFSQLRTPVMKTKKIEKAVIKKIATKTPKKVTIAKKKVAPKTKAKKTTTASKAAAVAKKTKTKKTASKVEKKAVKKVAPKKKVTKKEPKTSLAIKKKTKTKVAAKTTTKKTSKRVKK